MGKKKQRKRCKDYPGIVLTTAHSSKGMEWPIVINEISKYHDKNLVNEDVEEKDVYSSYLLQGQETNYILYHKDMLMAPRGTERISLIQESRIGS